MNTLLRCVLFLFVAPALHGTPVSVGPFAGLDLSEARPEVARAVNEASQDFERVISGELPIFAEFYEVDFHEMGDPRREHFLRFKGFHYSISVSKVPVTIGGQEGLIYGPRIHFSQEVFTGWLPEVECTRFVSRKDLSELLKGDGLGGRWRFVPSPLRKAVEKKTEGEPGATDNPGGA